MAIVIIITIYNCPMQLRNNIKNRLFNWYKNFKQDLKLVIFLFLIIKKLFYVNKK